MEEGDGEEGKGWMAEGETICGWDRRELLKGVVLILGMFVPSLFCCHCWAHSCLLDQRLSIPIGKFRDLQRVTVQYARVLDMVGDEDAMEST